MDNNKTGSTRSRSTSPSTTRSSAEEIAFMPAKYNNNNNNRNNHNDDDDDNHFEDDDDSNNNNKNNTSAVAKEGGPLGSFVSSEILNNSLTPTKPGRRRRSTTLLRMESYKKNASFDMAEDVYSFIIAAPILSWTFLFSISVILLKYIVFATLISDVDYNLIDGSDRPCLAVKFFLIPVAIAMQSDLMHVYAWLANFLYSDDALQVSSHATYSKFCLSYLLRFIDGTCSLFVNFSVMLQTDDVLGVFLNFAALHFLQDIDDIFYELAEKGFFGDRVEHMSNLCKQIAWPRRVGNEDCWKSRMITNMDSILFGFTFLILLAGYISVITVLTLDGRLNDIGHVGSFEWVGVFPVTDDSTYLMTLPMVPYGNDPLLKIVLYPTLEPPKDAMLIYSAEGAGDMIESDDPTLCKNVTNGKMMTPVPGIDTCYRLFLSNYYETEFMIDAMGMVTLTIFSEHVPCPFTNVTDDDTAYFFTTNASRMEVTPKFETTIVEEGNEKISRVGFCR